MSGQSSDPRNGNGLETINLAHGGIQILIIISIIFLILISIFS
jgi:hypothetical protein